LTIGHDDLIGGQNIMVEAQQIKEALKKLKETAPKRKFKQSIELIINLKDLNIKVPEEQVDLYINLPHQFGKVPKICAFVGPELREQAKEVCDAAVYVEEFAGYADKKIVKQLANNFDYFIAQATVMPKVAATFGRILGPRNKMPNPKAGLVVPPKVNLAPLMDTLRKTVRAKAKTHLSIQLQVGKEDQKEEEIIDNIIAIYKAVVHKLPRDVNNIKNIQLKLTMSKPVMI